MGFLSKLWKGVKKVFKEIFKPRVEIAPGESTGLFKGDCGRKGKTVVGMFLNTPQSNHVAFV